MAFGPFGGLAAAVGLSGLSACDPSAALWAASFRGVPFFVLNDEEAGGRRIVIHEFPGRDEPFNEDLGAKARRYEVTAYLASENSTSDAAALTAACDRRGPGGLVLPTHGPIQVRILDFKRSRERDRLGYIAYALSYVREGAANALVSSASLANLIFVAADAVEGAIGGAFAGSLALDLALPGLLGLGSLSGLAESLFDVNALSGLAGGVLGLARAPDHVRQALLDGLDEALAGLDIVRADNPVEPSVSSAQKAAIARLSEEAPALVLTDPAALAARTVSLARAIGDGLDADLAAPTLLALADAAPPAVPTRTATPNRRRAVAMGNAAARLTRVAALTAYAEAVARRTFRSRGEGITTRADVVEYLDAELEPDPVTGPVAGEAALSEAIESLRNAVVAYLTTVITSLAPVVTVETPLRQPALVLAYRLYADPARADELVDRNGVRVPSRMPLAFEALAPPMTDEILTIEVGGTIYTAFESATVTAAFDAAARSFDITIAAEFGGPTTKAIFAAGTPIVFRAGGDLLLTGYVDHYRPSITADSASIGVTGRSKSQDAIDCSAVHKTGRVEKKTPVEIAKAVSEGVDVDITTDQDLKPVEHYQVSPGETIFRLFEKLARRQGCTVTGTADGGMKATKPGRQRHAGGIHEGKNLKTGDADHDWSNRHSEYRIKGQRAKGHGKGALELEATAKDSAVKRHRPIVVIQEDDTDKATIKQRAETRRDRAAGEATTASITVQGFRDEAGRIWEPGWLVWTESPFLGLAQDMLIKSANYSESDDGALTRLDLCDPRAFGAKKGKGNKSGADWDQGSDAASEGLMSYHDHADAIRGMMRRAAIAKVEDDGSQQIVTARGLAGEEFKIYRQQAHGFSSNPPVGSEGHVIALGGRSDRLMFLQGEHEKHRPTKTPSGGAVVYDDKGNVSRYLGDDGIWHDAGNRAQKMTGRTLEHKATDKASFGGSVTYLGGNGSDGTYSPVMTEAGPSSTVFAKV